MQKTKVLCLILAIVLASAGTVGFVMGLGGESVEPILPNNSLNTIMDKPTEGSPVDRTAIENLYIAQGELQRKGGFVGTTRGTSTAAGVKQDVYNNRVVVGGNVFKEMITIGVVKNAYQLYMYGDNYLYRKFDSIKTASNVKWANIASKYSKDDFLSKFGHRSDSLTGYILNDDTIVSGTLENEENGLFRYRYVLDINTAPALMLREMKTNSNMSDYSTFIKAEIIVVMDSDWQVKTVTTDCKYKVPMFGGVDCVEDITETFSDVTNQDLPQKDFFEQFFDAEMENPVDTDPDALSILMDMFAPYIGSGNSLNAAITAQNNGQTVLDGVVSAKIDIENLDNIEVAAMLGDGLYVEYQQGKVYVSYQDFKASTTVDGIMGVVNTLMPQTNAVGLSDISADDILSKFTYAIVDGVCTVSLPLELGDEQVDINIYADVTDNGYKFTNANITLGSLAVQIELASAFDVPEHNGEYPEILGLLDIVKNGVIYGNVNAFNMDLDVMFDIATMSLSATGDNLSVIYQNDTIYARYGSVQAKLAIKDIDRIVTLLRLAGIADGGNSFALPQISLEQVIAMLGDIVATATDDGVAFSLNMDDDLSVAIYLAAGANGWNLDRITVKFGDNVITLAMSASFETEMPEVVDSEYADVMELLDKFINPIASLASASSYGAEFNFDVIINNQTYNVNGSFAYDVKGNIRVDAKVTNDVATLIKANAVVANGVVYLDANGVKAAFKIDGTNSSDVDLSQIVSEISGLDDGIDSVIKAVYGIINAAKNIDVTSIDFANIIKQFGFENGILSVTIDASFVELPEITVKLSTDQFNDLVVEIDGLEVGGIGVNAQATVIANVGKVKAPNADDYILNLKGKVEDIEFAVSADLLNMDISASVNVFNKNVLARYVDGRIYAQVDEIALVGTIDKLAVLINEIMESLGADGSAIDFSGLSGLDLSLQSVFNSIVIDTSRGALNVNINIDNVANVNLNFDSEANFTGIDANVMGYAAEVSKSDKRVPQLDVNGTYIPVELLTKQVVAIYNNFKNVLTTGIAVDVETTLSINGISYNLVASLKYNNGLYVNAKLSDSANVLVSADIYLVNNVLYADVNGVRVATELPATNVNNANVDLAAVLGALAQAKGYNDALDSVIAVVEQLPDKLNGINYLDLLASLTYNNNVLAASINGELLGLSNFNVTLQGTNDIALTLSNLVIGSVAIDSLAVNATPACSEVAAPTSEYVTELEIEVMGYKVTAKLDLYNKTVVAKTDLFNHELGIYYADNVVYVSYGAVKAKLNIAEADKLIAVISSFIDGGIPSVEMPELDVKQILDSISKVVTDSGYSLNASIAGVNITLSFDANAKLTNVYINVNDIDVTATVVNGATYPAFDLNADYVDLAALVEAFAGEVRNLINADGYDVTLNGNFAFDNNVYNVEANVIYNGGLYINANVRYNTANIINVKLWLVDNTLYVSAGDLKLAVALPQSASQNNGSGKIDLTAYKGYNPYVDGILDVVQGVIDKFMLGNIDYVSLLAALTYANGELGVSINGEQLGLSQVSVKLNANNGIYVNMSNLALDRMNASLTATVKASSTAVIAPQGDFTTNLLIRIDDKNTIYANLDLLHGVYNFRLDDLYVMYCDNVVKINKGNMYVSGDINAIIDYVQRIDKLVNDFSGATQSSMAGLDLSAFSSIDVKAIVKSLQLVALDESAIIKANAFGMDFTAMFAYGRLHTVTVPVAAIDKTLQIETCAPQVFDKFDNGNINYVAIEQIFDDYFPVFEKLVHTNSWKFSFDGDTLLTLSNANYMVAAGSYFEFYYKNTEGMDTFKLRAKLDIHKQRADNSWQPYMDIDIVYKDGNIYITDKGREIDKNTPRNPISITVSVNTLIKCYDLYDELVAVVPQIGELVNKVMSAMSEAEENAESISYATILSDIWYNDDKVFGLTLNGSALLSKLGEVILSAQTYGDGLSLNDLELHYDGISVKVSKLRVTASDLVEENGNVEYATVQDINAYNTEADHMDFNSLYELLSSFVITATPAEENDGARSFFIDGTATVKLKILNLNIADIAIGISVKVDITKDNDVYVAVKVNRTKPSGFGTTFVDVYDDKGGDSYLYFDGVNGTFTVIRNSIIDWKHTVQEEAEKWVCTKCGKANSINWCSEGGILSMHGNSCEKQVVVVDKQVTEKNYYYERHFAAENLTTEQFTADIMTYILEMFNFGSTIKDPIVQAMQEPNSSDYGIEDILKDYSYTATDKKYSLVADLTAIDSNLGELDVDIIHADDYSLTNLNIDMSLLKGMCHANVPFELKQSTCGEATQIVNGIVFW